VWTLRGAVGDASPQASGELIDHEATTVRPLKGLAACCLDMAEELIRSFDELLAVQ
jgi:hypothetical protein